MTEDFKSAYTELKNGARTSKIKIEYILESKDTFKNLPDCIGIELMQTLTKYFNTFCAGIDKYMEDIE
jgi:hypothetical protein